MLWGVPPALFSCFNCYRTVLATVPLSAVSWEQGWGCFHWPFKGEEGTGCQPCPFQPTALLSGQWPIILPHPPPLATGRAGGTWKGRARSRLPGQGWGLWKAMAFRTGFQGSPLFSGVEPGGPEHPAASTFHRDNTKRRVPKHCFENTGAGTL